MFIASNSSFGMAVENSSNLKIFGGSASHPPFSVWSDPVVGPLTCSCPHLVDSKTPLSVLQSQKMNPLRDWKRSGLCCPRNQTGREWDLWDEVIEIQIEIHSEGTFSSNAYFLGDWFVWGRLRRFNFLAFPTTFLLLQVLSVPSHSTQASSQAGPQGRSPFSVPQFPDAPFPWHSYSPLTLEKLYENGRFIPLAEIGVTGIQGKVQYLSGYPAAVCQNL